MRAERGRPRVEGTHRVEWEEEVRGSRGQMRALDFPPNGIRSSPRSELLRALVSVFRRAPLEDG